MQYTKFGKSGAMVSKLGFGCMRFPTITTGDKKEYDSEAVTGMIHRAIELGVNYFDSAPFYCDSKSEQIMGKALKGYRDKVYISTKYPIGKTGDDLERRVEESLKNLDTDYIDFYHFWSMYRKNWNEDVKGTDGPWERALKLREQGVIRNVSFSCHDTPENMIEIIKEGEGNFASLLCQYNLLDRANEEAIAFAHEQDMGVVIMGPVGGGRLGAPSPAISSLLPGKVKSSPEIALRFVMSNPNVNIALSGMGNIEMVEENCATASNGEKLSDDELARISEALEENRRLMELYCTGCNYCMPCPAGLDIPYMFRLMNYARVYDLNDYAREQYARIGVDNPERKNAAACVGCGLCETKCPQKLSIREQLKETHAKLAK